MARANLTHKPGEKAPEPGVYACAICALRGIDELVAGNLSHGGQDARVPHPPGEDLRIHHASAARGIGVVLRGRHLRLPSLPRVAARDREPEADQG